MRLQISLAYECDNSIEYAAPPSAYLHSAFIVQNGSSSGETRIADSAASYLKMPNNSNMYDMRPLLPGREVITIGDNRRLKVEFIGNIDIVFHGYTDERATLTDVSYIPD